MSQLDQPDIERHVNVKAWLRSVPDNSLHVSAITVMEAWRGLVAERKRVSADPDKLRDNDRYEAAFGKLLTVLADRIVPIDEPVAKLWGQLLGQRDKNRFDVCVAATAVVHEMIVATRNTKDFEGRGARVVDPFKQHSSPERA